MRVLLTGLLKFGFDLLQFGTPLARLLLRIEKALGHILLCLEDLCGEEGGEGGGLSTRASWGLSWESPRSRLWFMGLWPQLPPSMVNGLASLSAAPEPIYPISQHPLDSSAWTSSKYCHFTETHVNPHKIN